MGWHDHRGHHAPPVMTQRNKASLFDRIDKEQFYHSRRIYNNGDYVDNLVLGEHLKEHVEHNCLYRPGTALFIDGICVNKGYLDDFMCTQHSELLKHFDKSLLKHTVPYA